MNRYTFTIGQLYDKDARVVPISLLAARIQRANQYLATAYGGYSSHAIKSGWIDPGGKLLDETSLVYQVYTELPGELGLAAAEHLKEIFDQERVIFTSEKMEVRFV